MFITDYPGASRSTKSQNIKKWKTGTYESSINANAVVVKYYAQQEQDKKEQEFSDWADEKTRELDQEYHDIGVERAKLAGEQSTLDRNKKCHRIRDESLNETRDIIKIMRLKLKEEMNDFEYQNWAGNTFSRNITSAYGL
tara:strand:+ start:280 stop:699 length:420 start_codon:yes stop_codon:yes gene_type:complete